MTVVLVHGNPESDAVWRPLLDVLDRDDVVRLSPPGFGVPLSPGFEATVLGYRSWLEAELEQCAEPVDLVGHDWGGNHVVAVAMTRPDLIRSWATDTIGIFAPDYTWHPLAERWQTPGLGEEFVRSQFEPPPRDRAAMLEQIGVPASVSQDLADAMTPDMARAVLSLYRSAIQPTMADLGRHLERAATRPGLAVLATADRNLGTDEQRRTAAARAGATLVPMGLGHWWMAEDPRRAAEVLTGFWASTGSA